MRHLIAAVVLSLTGSAMAETWTVDDDGPADFDNIQAAVDAAIDGDEIVVEPGTYASEDYYVVDMGGKSLTLRSSGTAEATIIDAQGTYGIDCRYGVSLDGVIDGFTITGSDYWGIDCEGSSPTIRGCTITGNQGGVHFGESTEGEPTITDCLIVGNTAYGSLGGGICCSYSTSPTISNCTITGNSAGNTKITMGGGIYCGGGGCSPTISNCLIEENEAVIGGGIACSYEGNAISISGCSIINNTATCGVLWEPAPDVCGGGIYSYQHNVIMTSSSICGNSPNQIDMTNLNVVLIDNGDNVIRFSHGDLEYVLETWGTLWGSPGDVNYDGSVNIVDLLMVLSSWGPCP